MDYSAFFIRHNESLDWYFNSLSSTSALFAAEFFLFRLFGPTGHSVRPYAARPTYTLGVTRFNIVVPQTPGLGYYTPNGPFGGRYAEYYGGGAWKRRVMGQMIKIKRFIVIYTT